VIGVCDVDGLNEESGRLDFGAVFVKFDIERERICWEEPKLK
jgi:hypothetical protein